MLKIKKEFEKFLIKLLPEIKSFHPFFEDSFSYLLKAGGKRFRPMLLLSVVESYEPLLLKGSFYPAAAIEYLHTYSLIHDDLPAMDNAFLRRGKESVHIRFDEATAVLVGDGLNTYAFYVIAVSPLSNDIKIRLIRELSYCGGVGGMVLGQAINCFFEKKKLSLKELKFLHLHKTAKLIAASLKMGAIIVNQDKRFLEEIYDFGLDLGILFQIQDDLIDALEEERIAGKTILNDAQKNSFVTLLGVERSFEEAEKIVAKIENKINFFDKKLKNNLGFLIENYLYRHRKFYKKGKNKNEQK